MLTDAALKHADHNITLPEPYREKINVLLNEWRTDLKKWAKEEDKKASLVQFLFRKDTQTFFSLPPFFNFLLLFALLPLLYALLNFKGGWTDNLSPEGSLSVNAVGVLMFAPIALYFLHASYSNKKIQNTARHSIILALQKTFHLDWHEEAHPIHKTRKTISFTFACVHRPPPRDPLLDAIPSRSTYRRLKGKGAPHSATAEAALVPVGRAHAEPAEEKLPDLYPLEREGNRFGGKKAYVYIPPQIETILPNEARDAFRKILTAAQIVTAEGAQGIKYLGKELTDPGSSIKYPAWEIKRMDSLSTGDRLLGVP